MPLISQKFHKAWIAYQFWVTVLLACIPHLCYRVFAICICAFLFTRMTESYVLQIFMYIIPWTVIFILLISINLISIFDYILRYYLFLSFIIIFCVSDYSGRCKFRSSRKYLTYDKHFLWND